MSARSPRRPKKVPPREPGPGCWPVGALLPDLGLQVGVPEVLRGQRGSAVRTRFRRVGPQRREGIRLLAGLPPCAAELERADERQAREERLVAHHPGDAEFRVVCGLVALAEGDRKSTRLNSSHDQISYAVFCLKKKKIVEH